MLVGYLILLSTIQYIEISGGGGDYCHYSLDLQQQTEYGKCW